MNIVICGKVEGGPVMCRDVHIVHAMQVWGKWFPNIMESSAAEPLVVGPYSVWLA